MISEARSNDTEDEDMEIDNANDRANGESIAALPTWDAARASIQARKKRKRPTAMLLKSAMEDLDKIWETPGGEGGRACEAEPILPLDVMRKVQQTTNLLVKVFTKDIHEPAIQALATNEELKASKLKLQSELDTKSKEVERLRRSEQRSKEAIQVWYPNCKALNSLIVFYIYLTNFIRLSLDLLLFTPASHFTESPQGRHRICRSNQGRIPDQTLGSQDASRFASCHLGTRCFPKGLLDCPAIGQPAPGRRRKPQNRTHQAPARQTPVGTGGSIGPGPGGPTVQFVVGQRQPPPGRFGLLQGQIQGTGTPFAGNDGPSGRKEPRDPGTPPVQQSQPIPTKARILARVRDGKCYCQEATKVVLKEEGGFNTIKSPGSNSEHFHL